ncbi:hypothetical protein [Cellulophaga baltica]|uniref:hypothetical protein n=1 Tax=Cellulophaga baltica TaxID=76594 RepID=UPI0004045AC5|nr:hypothetical protein [Cellulophaga baltica]AIY13874.1 hypothetical protein M667_11995 [Cellulophaga baltica NN016038]
MDSNKFVLFTADNKYVVEYLLKQLILSDSITEALIFESHEIAIGFRKMLAKDCQLHCSINTYID